MIMRDSAEELLRLATRDEAGRHFTQWAEHWEELEAAGYIRVVRPVHETGIPFDQQYWHLELTAPGVEAAEAWINHEILPD